MSKVPTDDDLIPAEFEPMFEALLVQFDAALISGDPSGEIPADLKAGLPEGVLEELGATQSCLRLLHQMQSQSGSQVLEGSEPGASRALLERVTAERQEDLSSALIGRFEIERKLGEGTYGLVFVARDRDLNRRVALKIPRPEALVRPDLQERFLREAQASASLSHPNIVAVYHASAANGLHYIASEFIDGPNLGEWLAAHDGAVDPRQAASLVAAIAEGVDRAHASGILHRDIKPGNILLVPKLIGTTIAGSLDSFEPKLTDFGLAKTAGGSNGTLSGTIMGTPAYMAPEQISGKLAEVGPSADVYALGVVLCELLIGKNPFVGEGYEQTLHKVLHDECPALRRVNWGIPKDLAAICGMCLQKDPLLRYRSAADLAGDLRCFLEGKPIVARSASVSARFQKWCRRNPWLAIAGCVSLLSVLVLLVSTLRHNVELREANVRIQEERDSVERERQGAIASREQAVRNQRLALKMMQNLVSGVQEKLATRPGMAGLREELLLTAQQGLEDLARDSNGATSDVTKAYLTSLLQLSEVYGMYGETGKCDALLSRALSRALELQKQSPEDIELQTILASIYRAAGIFHQKIGKMGEAIPEFQASLAIHQKIAEAQPADSQRQQELSKSFYFLGHARYVLPDPQAALESYRASVKIAQPLVDAGARHPEFLNSLASGQRMIGDTLQIYFLDFAPAVQSFSDGLRTTHLGLEKDPDNHRLWLSLMGLHRGLTDTTARQGNRELARKHSQVYLDWSLKLMAVDPSNDRALRETLGAYQRLGDMEGGEGRWIEARKAWLEEFKLVELLISRGPKNVEYHNHTMSLANRFLSLGDLHYANATFQLSRKLIDAAEDLGNSNSHFLSAAIAHSINHVKLIKQTGDFSRGIEDYQNAVRFSEQLCQCALAPVNSKLTLAHSLSQAGAFEVLYALDPVAGEKLLNRADQILRELPAPEIPKDREDWNTSIKNVERMQGIVRASQEIDNLEMIRKQPANSQLDLLLIRSRKAFKEKNVERALQTAEALADLPESKLEGKFEAACVLARCASLQKAESGNLHQRAMQILERCAAEGLFKNLWNLGQYLSRPELASLRLHLPQSSPLAAYQQYLSAVLPNSQPAK